MGIVKRLVAKCSAPMKISLLSQSPQAFVRRHRPGWSEDGDGALIRLDLSKPERLRCWTLTQEGVDVGSACLRLGDQLMFTEMSGEAVDALAAHLATHEVPGLFAPSPLGERFARVYAASTGRGWRVAKRLDQHALTELVAPVVPGTHRLARPEDAETLAMWFEAQQREDNVQRPEDPHGAVARTMGAGELYVWEVGGAPVAMSMLLLGRSPVSAVVNHVYTPPERRRRGYASGLVGALCAHGMALGRTPRLSTDVGNAPARRVYARLGFEIICRMENIRFDS